MKKHKFICNKCKSLIKETESSARCTESVPLIVILVHPGKVVIHPMLTPDCKLKTVEDN